MKKNVMMRVASVLLICVLLTSSVISGTFAKYVTTKTGTDTARVAKWGVNITAEGTTFAKEYVTHDLSASVGTNSVISTDKVVAPGTSGTMATVELSGTPEVAVKVTYSANFALNDEWEVAGDFYCPLKVVVCGTVVNGIDFTSKAAFEAAVEALINGWSKQYAAGTDLSGVAAADDLVVYWEWPFYTSDANDAKDTALGNIAVTGNAATVTLDVTCTVTQID